MALQLVETKILPDAIQLRYADDPDSAVASEWCEFRVRLAGANASARPRPATDAQAILTRNFLQKSD